MSKGVTHNGPGSRAADSSSPERAGLVLGSLILVAAVANLNLSVANVALPDIGKSFDASQTMLDLIAVGYSLGLAASVLWFGALGDRYGRKLMIVGGMTLTVPACLLAGFAPSSGVLFAARVLGGLAAGMAYPTTLALITALWSGPARTKAIALWSALGGGVALLGPLISGALLEHFSWGSVFLVTLPLVAIALPMAIFFVPSHVNEGTEPVDNLGGMLSAVLVGGLIVAINFLPVPSEKTIAIVLLVIAAVAGVLFVIRQRRAANALYDLKIAARPTFWVAACAGIIVFGSLMGAAYISQQFLQNVLGYSTLDAGAAILPAGIFMVLVAPRSAKLVGLHGSRRTLLTGQAFLLVAFVLMLLLWKENAVLELAHGVSARDASRHGLWNGRLAARPGRGAHDLDLRGAPHRRLRVGDGIRYRELRAPRLADHASDAPALLCERGGPRRSASALRRPDHGGGPVVVPQGRPVGVPRSDRRDPDRDGARVPLLPEEGRGERAAGRVPRPGHRCQADRSPDRSSRAGPRSRRGAGRRAGARLPA